MTSPERLSPAYTDLKSAKARADQAHTLITGLAAAAKLNLAIRARISAIAEQGRDELGPIRTARPRQSRPNPS